MAIIGDDVDLVERHVLVIERRMRELRCAICSEDTEAVKWHYDNVLGAVAKLRRLVDAVKL